MLHPDELASLYKPEHFDERLKNVSVNDVAEKKLIITSISQLAPYIDMCREAGVILVSLHNVSRKHELFIEDLRTAKQSYNTGKCRCKTLVKSLHDC